MLIKPSFVFICIPIRIYLAYLAYKLAKTRPVAHFIMGAIALFVSIGFASLFVTNSRQFGFEAKSALNPQGIIWWNNVRPIHAAFYLAFAMCAMNYKVYAYKFLIADVVFAIFYNFVKVL